MQAQAVAQKLKAQGINVIDFQEGHALEDGSVRITDLIFVQVPTYGRSLNVVQQLNNGKILFKPPRRSVSALMADIRASLGMYA